MANDNDEGTREGRRVTLAGIILALQIIGLIWLLLFARDRLAAMLGAEPAATIAPTAVAAIEEPVAEEPATPQPTADSAATAAAAEAATAEADLLHWLARSEPGRPRRKPRRPPPRRRSRPPHPKRAPATRPTFWPPKTWP